jgi:hypothetical protein
MEGVRLGLEIGKAQDDMALRKQQVQQPATKEE